MAKKGIELADCESERELREWARDVLRCDDLLTIQVSRAFP